MTGGGSGDRGTADAVGSVRAEQAMSASSKSAGTATDSAKERDAMVTIGFDSPRVPWVWQSLALATTLLLGCTAGHRETRPRTTTVAPAPPPPKWHRFSDVASWPPQTRPFRTEHLTGARWAVTHASPEAASAYATLVAGATLPDGSALVQALSETEGAEPVEFLVMERSAGTWDYLALDGDGRRAESLEPALCRRCHQEAPSDEVFGVGAVGLLESAGSNAE